MTAHPPIHHPLPDAAPLPRALPGLYARAVRQSCAGLFAVVWAEAEPPAPGRAGIETVDEVDREMDGEHFPAHYAEAFAEGLHAAWTSEEGPRPGWSARVRITDARWHQVDSSERSFRLLGGLLAAEITASVAEGRAPLARLVPRYRALFSWERDLPLADHRGAP